MTTVRRIQNTHIALKFIHTHSGLAGYFGSDFILMQNPRMTPREIMHRELTINVYGYKEYSKKWLDILNEDDYNGI